MKLLLVILSLAAAVSAQGYNYQTTRIQEQVAVAPLQADYIPPAEEHLETMPIEVQAQPQREYLAPVPLPVPAALPVQSTGPVLFNQPIQPIQAQEEIQVSHPEQYLAPQETAELADDGYRYRTVKKYKIRRH